MQSAMNKAEFRKLMLARVAEVSDDEKKASDEAIATAFFEQEEYADAKMVFAYIGVGDEVSTGKIVDRLLKEGKRLCVPLCHGGGRMDAIEIRSRDELVPGRYNIPEPANKEECIPPEEIDLVIVPGVAFGENGTRLGRGGGYYDRFLQAAKNASRIALAREVNVEKSVPCEAHDECVDKIVTETRVIKLKVR